MKSKNSKTDTIKRLQRDDLAKQAAIRFQQDPTMLDRVARNPVLRDLKELAADIMAGKRTPERVSGWIALVLFYGADPQVLEQRQAAKTNADAAYTQAERWIELIDRARDEASHP